jgi:hypothetical protein
MAILIALAYLNKYCQLLGFTLTIIPIFVAQDGKRNSNVLMKTYINSMLKKFTILL